MPAYLCHGFRWHRRSIRVFVVVQDLDDAAPEWIIGRRSASALLGSFYNVFDFLPRLDNDGSSNRPTTPKQRHQQSSSLSTTFSAAASSTNTITSTPTATTDDVMGQEAWSAVRLLEEYDPTRLDEVSRPHAYVADYVVRIDLSVSIVDEMTRYEERLRVSNGGKSSAAAGAEPPLPPAMAGPHSDETGRKRPAKEQRKAGWLEKLRDQLQRGEEIRWYVVVNGDEERPWEYGEYGENGQGCRMGESGVDEEDDGGLEAEYNRALEARQRQQEQQEQAHQKQQLMARQQPQQPQHYHHHHQQQQQQQPQQPQNDATPRQRPQPRFNGDGAGRSVDSNHRERERQRLRQQLGGLDIDSDGEDAPAPATPSSRLRSRSRGNSNKGLPPPPPLEPLPPESCPVHRPAPKMSMDGSPMPPKTPKSGGFRRLFGRGHSHKGSTAESP